MILISIAHIPYSRHNICRSYRYFYYEKQGHHTDTTNSIALLPQGQKNCSERILRKSHTVTIPTNKQLVWSYTLDHLKRVFWNAAKMGIFQTLWKLSSKVEPAKNLFQPKFRAVKSCSLYQSLNTHSKYIWAWPQSMTNLLLNNL